MGLRCLLLINLRLITFAGTFVDGGPSLMAVTIFMGDYLALTKWEEDRFVQKPGDVKRWVTVFSW